ncbi:MAG: acyltransferase family protein [Bdellovibrionia bacterium]
MESLLLSWKMSFLGPHSPIPVGLGLIFCGGIARVFDRFLRKPPTPHLDLSLQGLRGVLALCIVFHHAEIWWVFFQTGVWKSPESSFYNHLGESSVALFFMITAFLFTRQILNSSPEQGVDWLRLYRKRFLRIAPLYGVFVGLVFLTLGQITHWRRAESWADLALETTSWLLFTVLGRLNLNHSVWTAHLVSAGVSWSLPFEWAFYFSLPLLAWILGRKSTVRARVLSFLACTALAYPLHWMAMKAVSFLGGVAVSLILMNRRWAQVCRSSWVSLAIVGLLVFLVLNSPTADTAVSQLVLTLIFGGIAGGSSLGGLLHLSGLQFLGTISYGVYLLHGVILFWIFHWVVGMDQMMSLSFEQYWGVVLSSFGLILGLATLSFRWIEFPAMSSHGYRR